MRISASQTLTLQKTNLTRPETYEPWEEYGNGTLNGNITQTNNTVI